MLRIFALDLSVDLLVSGRAQDEGPQGSGAGLSREAGDRIWKQRTECSPSPFEYCSAVELVSRLVSNYHVQCLLVPWMSGHGLETGHSNSEPSGPGFVPIRMRRQQLMTARHSPQPL